MLNEQSERDEVNITILNCSVSEAPEKTHDRTIDAAYFIIPASMEDSVRDYCLSHRLLITRLKELTCQINVRENHPILGNFTKEQLWNYPFVDFINQSPFAYDVYQRYINPNKIIEVDHHSLRSKIVSETDAFSIGVPLSGKTKETLHIIGIPTPELKMQIYEIRRQSDKGSALFNRYRHIIEKDLLEL